MTTYTLVNYPLGPGQEPAELKTFTGETALEMALNAFRNLISDYAMNAVELHRDPDLSPRTVFGDEPDLNPYLEASFRLGQAKVDGIKDKITLETDLEKVVLRAH